ncbi:unnamed protein product [Cunninghamella blakesleeana]
MSGYQSYYPDGQPNKKSTVNTSAYGNSTQMNYYNSYQQQQQQPYGGYDGYYEGYDPSQYYDPNAYYGGEDYYQAYGQENNTNSVARYSHSFAEDGSSSTAPNPSTNTTTTSNTNIGGGAMDKKAMDGLTSAQRKKLAYYQYFGEDIPEHTTSGYTRADAQGIIKPNNNNNNNMNNNNNSINNNNNIPSTSTPSSNATIAAAPTVGGKMKKNKNEKGGNEHSNKKKSTTMRFAAGEVWEDKSLGEWDDNDFRLFAGDLGNEVTDETLFKAFAKYPGCQKARVVRDKRSGKTRGYGFISFSDANDFVKAWREMNGKYVGNRPIKLRKSTWQDRNIDTKMKKEKEKLGPYSKRR